MEFGWRQNPPFYTVHSGPPISIETQKGMDWIDGTGYSALKMEK